MIHKPSAAARFTDHTTMLDPLACDTAPSWFGDELYFKWQNHARYCAWLRHLFLLGMIFYAPRQRQYYCQFRINDEPWAVERDALFVAGVYPRAMAFLKQTKYISRIHGVPA